ncbi:MAG: hypothetical protein AAFN27_19325 [Pseudomonadota bacterium]
MQRLLILFMLVTLAACAGQPKKPASAGDPHAKNLVPNCYTVDLFDPYFLEYPDEKVSDESRAFLGVWRQGAWNGEWCHDLYVTAVYPDGSVDVLDLYGPLYDANIEATVFKRKGQIREGQLVINSIGFAQSVYRREGRYLLGKRSGIHGDFNITMLREERVAEVPIPPINPRRS